MSEKFDLQKFIKCENRNCSGYEYSAECTTLQVTGQCTQPGELDKKTILEFIHHLADAWMSGEAKRSTIEKQLTKSGMPKAPEKITVMIKNGQLLERIKDRTKTAFLSDPKGMKYKPWEA